MPLPNDLPAAGATGHVLVVDDDPQNRNLLADWLRAYGHEVAMAGDGERALRAVAEDPPDAILLDVMMPGLDGYAVCERLKKNPQTAGIPVLFLSALGEREERLRGMQVGANDFLPKPVDLQYVLLRVRNAVQLRQLNRALEIKFRELRRLERLKDDLLHMLVHDLRTPLAGMEGYLQMLKMAVGDNLGERPNHYLNQALTSVHHLAHQIDLLLDIHRMEEGRMPVQTAAHDLRQVVTEALQPLETLLASRQLQIDPGENPVPALGDPNLLRRVVTNLVGNAISFTSPQTGRILIRVGQDGGRARMEVADNGPGIDPHFHEAIFEKFAQADDQVRDQSSGLGLAFCKLAIEAQKGRIGVESQRGEGSRFWFEVPAAEAGSMQPWPQRS